jgi:hypothetical protein
VLTNYTMTPLTPYYSKAGVAVDRSLLLWGAPLMQRRQRLRSVCENASLGRDDKFVVKRAYFYEDCS